MIVTKKNTNWEGNGGSGKGKSKSSSGMLSVSKTGKVKRIG